MTFKVFALASVYWNTNFKYDPSFDNVNVLLRTCVHVCACVFVSVVLTLL